MKCGRHSSPNTPNPPFHSTPIIKGSPLSNEPKSCQKKKKSFPRGHHGQTRTRSTHGNGGTSAGRGQWSQRPQLQPPLTFFSFSPSFAGPAPAPASPDGDHPPLPLASDPLIHLPPALGVDPAPPRFIPTYIPPSPSERRLIPNPSRPPLRPLIPAGPRRAHGIRPAAPLRRNGGLRPRHARPGTLLLSPSWLAGSLEGSPRACCISVAVVVVLPFNDSV